MTALVETVPASFAVTLAANLPDADYAMSVLGSFVLQGSASTGASCIAGTFLMITELQRGFKGPFSCNYL